MSRLSHDEVNVALAEALGLDPLNGLVSFTVDVEKDRYPVVTTVRRTRDGVEKTDIPARFKLVPIEDDTE